MTLAYRQEAQSMMGNSCSSGPDSVSQPSSIPNNKKGDDNKTAQEQNGIPYARPNFHSNCIAGVYPRTENEPKHRFTVPNDKVSWDVDFPGYNPIDFFAVQPVPIPEDPDYRKEPDQNIKWNEKTDVNRKSYQGDYDIVNNVPRNPVGRTGMTGRGSLARWGPNQAADPIVTRWKRDEKGEITKHETSNKPILEFVSIQRSDCGMWALPGV